MYKYCTGERTLSPSVRIVHVAVKTVTVSTDAKLIGPGTISVLVSCGSEIVGGVIYVVGHTLCPSVTGGKTRLAVRTVSL